MNVNVNEKRHLCATSIDKTLQKSIAVDADSAAAWIAQYIEYFNQTIESFENF